MILDTTAVIDIIKGNLDMGKKLDELEKENIAIFITSVSVFEIWQGSGDIEDEEELSKIHILLESLGVFLLDIPSAKEAGIIHSSLKKKGLVIDPEDSMTAGIAKFRKEPILTRNVKHFSRIDGIEIESY